MFIQLIADREAKNLEIISKTFQFSTMRTRILTGFIIGTKLLHGTNRKSHGQDCGSLKKFEKQSQDFSATLVAIGCMIHLYV